MTNQMPTSVAKHLGFLSSRAYVAPSTLASEHMRAANSAMQKGDYAYALTEYTSALKRVQGVAGATAKGYRERAQKGIEQAEAKIG